MSPQTMSRERFQDLAQAYGAQVSRWPEEWREAAALLMSQDPEFARTELARAEALDRALDGWRPAPASAALRERIVATAPAPRTRAWRWLSPAALATGLAAACASGLVAGAILSERVGASSGASGEQVAAAFNLEPSLDLEGA